MSAENDAVPPRRPGPFDDAKWPEKLAARVVTPGDAPRIHGYDVEKDLARHYSFSETTLLALTGELPSEAQANAFRIALQFLSPAPVNEAPAHAAVLVRICNVPASAVIATAALALGEQARVLVARHAGWLGWLDAKSTAPVVEWAPIDSNERRSVDNLREALASGSGAVPGLDLDVSRTAAILAVLHFAGLKTAERMEAVIVLARLPAAIAEGLAVPTHSYMDYPVGLPPIRYTEQS